MVTGAWDIHDSNFRVYEVAKKIVNDYSRIDFTKDIAILVLGELQGGKRALGKYILGRKSLKRERGIYVCIYEREGLSLHFRRWSRRENNFI